MLYQRGLPRLVIEWMNELMTTVFVETGPGLIITNNWQDSTNVTYLKCLLQCLISSCLNQIFESQISDDIYLRRFTIFLKTGAQSLTGRYTSYPNPSLGNEYLYLYLYSQIPVHTILILVFLITLFLSTQIYLYLYLPACCRLHSGWSSLALTDDWWSMMDDWWWMKVDGWWMLYDGWWIKDEGWWMMVVG